MKHVATVIVLVVLFIIAIVQTAAIKQKQRRVYAPRPAVVQPERATVDSYAPPIGQHGPQQGRHLEPALAPDVQGPHALNIDFGRWKHLPSEVVGPAVVGQEGDFWNAIAVPWDHDHTEYNLRSTRGEVSPIRVRMVNLGGGWANQGKLGNRHFMLEDFNYPANNRGGNAEVHLINVPAGYYDLYLYGRGSHPLYYGDYSVAVSGRVIGRKATSNQESAVTNPEWREGDQYVRFAGLAVNQGEDIDIIIYPGGEVTDGRPGTFNDAMICGLQLIPSQGGGEPPVDWRDEAQFNNAAGTSSRNNVTEPVTRQLEPLEIYPE